ncbi:MAG: hypothetical protein IPG06_20945 [Haliea sp.]|nr:hypothetical protein [Haliea sp.]
MKNKISIRFAGAFLACFLFACSDSNDNNQAIIEPPVPDVELADNVLVLTDEAVPNFYLQEAIDAGEEDPAARLGGEIHGKPVTIVKLRGKTNHFGMDIQQSPPKYLDLPCDGAGNPRVDRQSIETRELDLQTDGRAGGRCTSSRIPGLIYGVLFRF